MNRDVASWGGGGQGPGTTKKRDLSRLGNRFCPGFPTRNASPGQKGVPFCPGSGNRDKREPFVPVGGAPLLNENYN